MQPVSPIRALFRWACLLFIFAVAPVRGELSQELVANAKKATALLVHETETWTAFCISEDGYFVTIRQPFETPRKGFSLVIDPGGKEEKRYEVKNIRRLPDSDIALIKVELGGKFSALKLGDDKAVFETQQLYSFGYTAANQAQGEVKEYPSLSVDLARVTSLRKKQGVLDAIIMDGIPKKSAAGSPVLDEKGNVVAVKNIMGFGGNKTLAIPISVVKSAFLKPVFTLDGAPLIDFQKRFEQTAFSVTVEWLQAPAGEPEVALVISGDGEPRRIKGIKGEGGKYTASFAPVLKKPGDEKNSVDVSMEFAGGKVAGRTEDIALTFEGKKELLSSMRQIERWGEPPKYSIDGRHATDLPELAGIKVDLGGVFITVDGRRAKKLTVTPITPEIPSLSFKWVASVGGVELHESLPGKIKVAEIPSAPVPAPVPLKRVVDLTEPREIKLPSPVSDVVAGADGRLLILYLKDAKKLAIFDTAELKIRGYVSLAADPVLFAAGSRYLLIVYPTANLIQRYSLETLEKEKTINNPFGQITHISMGYSAPTNALILVGGRSSYDTSVTMFDVEKMAAIPGNESKRLDRLGGGTSMAIRASADGRTFGVSRAGVSPSGFTVVTFKNGTLATSYEHDSVGALVPNQDGTLICTTYMGVFTPKYVPVIKKQGGWSEGTSFLPSYHPMYLIAVPYGERRSGKNSEPLRTIAIHVGTSSQSLVNLEGPFEEMTVTENTRHTDGDVMSFDKRYHFFPQVGLFLTIPPTNDRIVARPVDVQKTLDAKGIDYLYVTSIHAVAKAGALYRYQIESASKAGSVTYSLQSGPDGMKVSSAGEVTWQVPPAAGEETVIVVLKDGKGQEAFHTFQLGVSR